MWVVASTLPWGIWGDRFRGFRGADSGFPIHDGTPDTAPRAAPRAIGPSKLQRTPLPSFPPTLFDFRQQRLTLASTTPQEYAPHNTLILAVLFSILVSNFYIWRRVDARVSTQPRLSVFRLRQIVSRMSIAFDLYTSYLVTLFYFICINLSVHR
jgi:hypothetical protein